MRGLRPETEDLIFDCIFTGSQILFEVESTDKSKCVCGGKGCEDKRDCAAEGKTPNNVIEICDVSKFLGRSNSVEIQNRVRSLSNDILRRVDKKPQQPR